MNTERIKKVLSVNAVLILTAQTFEDRMRAVYEILDQEFPVTSFTSALYGSITSLVDFTSRGEIERLLDIIKKSIETGKEFITTDSECNSILEYIYERFK